MPVVERIFATFGDSDVRTIVCVPTTPAIAKRILGADVDRWLVWCDPDRAFVESLGLERLPAFVHLRLDTTLVSAAQGWSPSEWQKVADEIARHEHWTLADRVRPGRSRPDPGLADRQLSSPRLAAIRGALTRTNVADVTIGARDCLASTPMSRRSVCPHRGAGLLAGPAPHPEPCARSGPRRDDRFAAPPARRPQSDLASQDGAGPAPRGADRRRTADAPTSSTSSTCRRRPRSPTPNAPDRRRAEQGIAVGTRAGVAAAHAARRARGAALHGRRHRRPARHRRHQRAGARLAGQVRRGRGRDRQPHDRPARRARRAAPASRPRTSRSRRPKRRSARTRPTPRAQAGRADQPRRCSRLLNSTKSDIRALANKIEQRRASQRRPRPNGRASRPQAAAQAAAAQRWRWRRDGGGGVGITHGDIGVDPGASPRRAAARRRRGRVRPGADRQAVPVRRHRARLVRLLRPHDDGVGAGRRLHVARLAVAVPDASRTCRSAELQPGDLVFFGSSGPSEPPRRASTSAAAR